MPINVSCSACSATFKVRDEFGGRRTKCKHCGSPIAIPNVNAGPQNRPPVANPATAISAAADHRNERPLNGNASSPARRDGVSDIWRFSFRLNFLVCRQAARRVLDLSQFGSSTIARLAAAMVVGALFLFAIILVSIIVGIWMRVGLSIAITVFIAAWATSAVFVFGQPDDALTHDIDQTRGVLEERRREAAILAEQAATEAKNQVPLLVPPRRQEPPKPPVTRCPFCLEMIAVQALKCKHCGEVLDDDLRRERQSQRPEHPLPVARAYATAPSHAPGGSWFSLFGCLVVVFVGVGAAIAVVVIISAKAKADAEAELAKADKLYDQGKKADAVAVLVSPASAEEKKATNKEKIVGVWDLVAGSPELSEARLTFRKGASISMEFTKDGKYIIIGKVDEIDLPPREGTYSLDGDKLISGTETYTITKLTDKELVFEEKKDGKTDTKEWKKK
jgi:hypothetical protein